MDRQTDDPNTRCPLSGRGHKKITGFWQGFFYSETLHHFKLLCKKQRMQSDIEIHRNRESNSIPSPYINVSRLYSYQMKTPFIVHKGYLDFNNWISFGSSNVVYSFYNSCANYTMEFSSKRKDSRNIFEAQNPMLLESWRNSNLQIISMHNI